MAQEEKQLLLVDLCARLSYGVCAKLPNHHLVEHVYKIEKINMRGGWTEGILDCAMRQRIYSAKIEDVKPYLRPMSSMTEEEKEEYELLANRTMVTSVGFVHLEATELIEWLNKKMFDYHVLIPKGLALEAPEGMYNINKK